MLTLFEGSFASPMHSGLIEAIKSAVERGVRVYLIVPEQETVNAECEMSRLLPPSAPLSFEVTNFTRFTNTAFREIGGISGEYCNPAAKSLLMWRTLTELSPMLALTRGRKSISDGLVKKALSATAEVQALGITPDMLAEAAAEDLGDRRLGDKLNDLSLIYTLYTDLVSKRFSDTANDAAVLAEMLKSHPDFISGCEIFVDGFTSFTDGQRRLLGALMRSASLTVTLDLGRGGECYEFAECEGTRRRLAALAAEGGVEVRLKKFTSRDQGYSPVIGEICDLLWRTEGKIDNDSLQMLAENGGRLRIFKAQTMYEECELLAADIKRRAMAGEKYSDMAIVAKSTDGYLGVLDTALDGAEVPYFVSRVAEISSVPLFKMISIAYKLVETGYRREDVLTYLKCGLSPISRDEADRFELYTEKWAIDGRRFTDGIRWNMNPHGYDRAREGDAELLLEIDATREKLLSPLVSLEAAVQDAKTVRAHAEALLDFLKATEAEEAMAKRAEQLFESGEGEDGELCRRAWGLMCDALDTMVDLLGEVAADARSFSSQLTAVLGAAAVGRIPAFSDAVTRGSADMIRVRGKKHIYMIGVNAGEFPASVGESSYFAESERAALMELGLPIEPELEIKSARELYSFSRAFSSATDSVTLLYAEKTAMLASLSPAEVIGRIGEITSGAVVPVKASALPKSELLYSKPSALEALGRLGEEEEKETRRALLLSGWGEKLAVADGNVRNGIMELGDDALALIYGKDIYLSQTKIDKFLGCPMSYFCKYGLRLGEENPAELGSNVIGSFVHAVIENFFGELERSNLDAGELSSEVRDGITKRAAEAYAAELLGASQSSARTRVAISRLIRATRPVVDGLCDELAGCKYKPTFFELETNAHNDEAPDPVVIKRDGGGRVILRGTIDRVDTYKSGDDVYVRIIDYKTGHTDFLPSKLKDGEYLQMFLYLKAISDTKKEKFLSSIGVENDGRIIPAGVIYVKTKVADATVRTASDEEASAAVKKLQERDGMLLLHEDSIGAMNPDFIPPEKKKSEPLRYTEEGWAEIEQTLTEVALSVADGMTSGRVKATPATKGGRNCKWRKYKEVCRSAVIKNDF